MRRITGWRHVILVACLLTGCMAQAGFMSRLNPFKRWSSKTRVETLIVTGNYGHSRLLAELAQYKTKQPIILVDPETADGRSQLFFMPSAPEAMVFEAGKYRDFVDFLNPQRIVFLGDNGFVPQSFIEQVRGTYPTVVINSRDWVKNAKALATILKYKKLPKHYSSYLEKLDAAAGGQAVDAGKLATPAAAAEPMLSPQLMPPIEGPAQ